MDFYRVISDPFQASLESFNQQSKMLSRLQTSFYFGKLFLKNGIAQVKGSNSMGLVNPTAIFEKREAGNVLGILEFDPLAAQFIQKEVDLLRSMYDVKLLGKIATTMRSNMTVFSPTTMMSNYVSNIFLSAMNGSLMMAFQQRQVGDIATAVRLSARDQINLSINIFNMDKHQLKDSVREAVLEMGRYGLMVTGEGAMEAILSQNNAYTQMIGGLFDVLNKYKIMNDSKTESWQARNVAVLKAFTSTYQFADEIPKILSYMVHKQIYHNIEFAKLSSSPNSVQIEEAKDRVIERAIKIARDDNAIWAESPLMVRQLFASRHGMHMIMPTFIMHHFQMLRVSANNLRAFSRIRDEIKEVQDSNATPEAKEIALKQLKMALVFRTIGTAVTTGWIIGLCTGTTTLLTSGIGLALSALGFGGDSDEGRDGLSQLTLAHGYPNHFLSVAVDDKNSYAVLGVDVMRLSALGAVAPQKPPSVEFDFGKVITELLTRFYNDEGNSIPERVLKATRLQDRYNQDWKVTMSQAGVDLFTDLVAPKILMLGHRTIFGNEADDQIGLTFADRGTRTIMGLGGIPNRYIDTRQTMANTGYKLQRMYTGQDNPEKRAAVEKLKNLNHTDTKEIMATVQQLRDSFKGLNGQAQFVAQGWLKAGAGGLKGYTKEDGIKYLTTNHKKGTVTSFSKENAAIVMNGGDLERQFVIKTLQSLEKKSDNKAFKVALDHVMRSE
jgi:bacterioferritin (cytochrome b1)